MSDDRKKPLWPWIVAVLIGLPVLYVASFGPACWLCEKQFAPTHVAWIIFRPLTYVVVQHPYDVGTPIRKYAAMFSESNDVGLNRRGGARRLSLLHRPFRAGHPIDYEIDHERTAGTVFR